MNHDDKIRDIENIDNIIYIEIFDYNINSDLYDIIISNIIYNSCNLIYLNLLYIKNKKYSKKYS